MKTEREMFLAHQDQRIINLIEYSKEHDCFRFKVTNTDLEIGVRLHTLNYGWRMWCASASREGYKLVPVETLKKTIGHICTAMHHPLNTRQEEDIMQSDMDIIEKAMTGVAP